MSEEIVQPLFDVVEVEIAAPHARRVMERAKTKKNAEAIIYMAIARRGVETHFYTMQPTAEQAGRSEENP